MHSKFLPLQEIDGFSPIEDHGLLSDCETAALVSRNGTIDWLCLPRFDSPPYFASLLDPEKGGCFSLRLNRAVESRQHYLGDTPVLVTELKSATGVIRITDALLVNKADTKAQAIGTARGALIRKVECISGSVQLSLMLSPSVSRQANIQPDQDGFVISDHDDPHTRIMFSCSRKISLPADKMSLEQGARVYVSLCWGSKPVNIRDAEAELETTRRVWSNWSEQIQICSPHKDLVKRSAITLECLDYARNGAIIAAPTSSLPERVGGARNWDYRYAWIRDAAMTVYAMNRVGLNADGRRFLAWVLNEVERDHGKLSPLYTVSGKRPPRENIVEQFSGYRDSQPVRWGNLAKDQNQNDLYGEIVDCAYMWAEQGGAVCDRLWEKVEHFVDRASANWRSPDYGIWEIRSSPARFTYSAALCHVALDRGIKLAHMTNHQRNIQAWRREAQCIRAAVLEQAWSEHKQSFTQVLHGDSLDASLLALPLRRVIGANHPKMIATARAIQSHLSAGDGLLHRYDPDISPDGLPGAEGAFMLCSFWLVENLALQNKLDEAFALFERLCSYTNHVGLLPEEIDPSSKHFLGNFPQALSHVGLISASQRLGRVAAGYYG